MITQRPSELSDTCISQCSNFLILRVLHPVDLDFIKNMVPNITNEVVLELKNLKPGNCIAFGSAFKVPISMHIEIPDPRPLSNNVNLQTVWYSRPEAIKAAKPVEAKDKTIIGGSNPVGGVMAGRTNNFFNEDVSTKTELLDVNNVL